MFILTRVNINSDETLSYSFTVGVKKCGGSCNTVDDRYAWVCVPNKVKTCMLKNLMSRVNETSFLFQHESCECKCRLNESVCNSKQNSNHD